MSTFGINRPMIRQAFKKHWIFLFLFLFAAALATYRLPESPLTGYDEGILVQMAVNAADHGTFDIRLTPDTFTSGAYMSTGFPALAPVSLSLRIFGTSLLHARAVIVGFLFVLLIAMYLAASQTFGRRAAMLSVALLVTHASLYAYGKPVMGEIPGLAYLTIFLFGLGLLENNRTGRSLKQSLLLVIIASLALGLAAVTKPVYLVALPAAGITLFLFRKRLPITRTTIIASIITLLICGGTWLATQFSLQDNAQEVLLFYRNPYLIQDVGGVILANLKRLFTEGTPLYVVGLYAVWTLSILFRMKKRDSNRVSAAESCAWMFGVLILAAYLRTPGFYRYFFYANVIAIFAFPAALEYVIRRISSYFKRWNAVHVAKDLAVFLTVALVLLQGYRLFTTSYIATTYKGTQTAALERYFSTGFESWREPYIYDAPVIPPYLPTERYTQFIEVSGHGRFALGPSLEEMLNRQVQTIILGEKYWYANPKMFSEYKLVEQIQHYVVVERVHK